ncbi:MAG: pyridine nucleotide-disulfide oxidoreductase [Haemophilus parainfluenzae]|nr:pyridine nucleotide-disulfide oxidoreductase [Haemophilus parainfluenzae]
MISVFDMFKVGVGPSSSHTVGPMKAGKQFIDDLIEQGKFDAVATLHVDVYGSLSMTGHGHNTDIAIIMGLAGYLPHDVDIDLIPTFIEQVKQTKKLSIAQGKKKVNFDWDANMVFHNSFLSLHENGMTITALDADRNVLYRQTYYSIGGGFIGIEVAENLAKAGKKVTVVEAMNQILAPFDYDMVQMLHKELLDNGVSLIVEDGVKTIEEKQITLASGKTVPADAVILAIGVAPETGLAKAAGLEIGETGGILVDHNYRTSDKNIYAVGDAIEVFDRMTGKPSRLALAGPALRQARAAADAMYGIPDDNRGVIGSCALRVFGLNAAATGLNERNARKAGIPCDFVYVIPGDKVGIMPGSAPMHFKLVFEVPTGRILGAQAIGRGNVDKRVDVIAAMVSMNGTIRDLKNLELCYSPVFGTARDVVNQAALVAENILYGRFRQVPVTQVRSLVEEQAFIVDVREKGEYEAGHLKGSVNIPLSELRERTDEIPKDRPVYLHCRSSQRSYNALMALQGRGYENVVNISGSFLGICLYEYYNDVAMGREKIVTEYNFA